MHSLGKKEVICAVCGEKSWQAHTYMPGNEEAADLDGKPSFLIQNAMEYLLNECPKCGYIEKDISKRASMDIEEIKKFYKPFDELYDSALAARFAKYACYLSSKGDIAGACDNFLYSAWVYDDLKKRDRAQMMRRCALDIANYLTDSVFLNERKRYILLRADLLRRVGEHELVLEINQNNYTLEEYEINQLLFEKELARKEDIGAHTIEECLNFKYRHCEVL